MNKGIVIIGAAIIALALFWKPIQNMLNSITGGGGGGGLEDQYVTTRDASSRSQGDQKSVDPQPPPSKDDQPIDGGKLTFVDTKDQEQKGAADTSGAADKPPETPINTSNILQSLAEGGAWVAGAAIVTKASQKTIPKAYQWAKEAAPKVKEGLKKATETVKKEAPKAIEVAKNFIKKPIGKAALALTAYVAIDEGIARYTGKQSVLSGLINNPINWSYDRTPKQSSGYSGSWSPASTGGSAPSRPYTPGGAAPAISTTNKNPLTGSPTFTNTFGGWSSNQGGMWINNTFYQGKYNVKTPPPPPPPPPKGGKKK